MTTEEINNLPSLEVLDRLSIAYKKAEWYEYRMERWWHYANWRKVNIQKKVFGDFSHDDSKWKTFWFVMSYLWLDTKETFAWFEEKFDSSYKPKQYSFDQPIKSIAEVRSELTDLDNNHSDYLKSRCIDVKKIQWAVKLKSWIACLLYSEWKPIWCNIRTLSNEKEKRFKAVPWYWTNWIYQHDIWNADYIIVVEWMMDFLTIRQRDSNVIWLKSSQSWLLELKQFANRKIYFVPDNDEAWEETIMKLPINNFYIMKLPEWIKDINQLYMETWWNYDISDFIRSSSEEIKKNTTINTIITEAKKEQKLWFYYPWDVFWPFWALTSWEFTVIASKPNVWKSTFADKIVKEASKRHKVAYINLEFPVNDMLEIFYKRSMWCDDFNIVQKGTDLDPYTESELLWLDRYISKAKWMVDYFEYEQWTKLDIIVEKIKELSSMRYKMIVIDSFSSIEDCKDNIKTQTKVASAFHEIVKHINISLVVLHHFNKTWENFAGSQKIEDLANCLITIKRVVDQDRWSYREFCLVKKKEMQEQKIVKTVLIQWEYDIFM